MLTILFKMTVEPEQSDAFVKTASTLMKTTRAEDGGCLAYDFFREADSSRNFILFEQWSDAEALNAHIVRLQVMMGPPDDDEALPATHYRRRLPKPFLDMFEDTSVTRYEPLG